MFSQKVLKVKSRPLKDISAGCFCAKLTEPHLSSTLESCCLFRLVTSFMLVSSCSVFYIIFVFLHLARLFLCRYVLFRLFCLVTSFMSSPSCHIIFVLLQLLCYFCLVVYCPCVSLCYITFVLLCII